MECPGNAHRIVRSQSLAENGDQGVLANETEVVMPSVSVVVLCRNQESNLAQILAALDSQTLRPAEVIIADDRSVGHIEAVAARSGCRYVSTAPHLGDHRDG